MICTLLNWSLIRALLLGTFQWRTELRPLHESRTLAFRSRTRTEVTLAWSSTAEWADTASVISGNLILVTKILLYSWNNTLFYFTTNHHLLCLPLNSFRFVYVDQAQPWWHSSAAAQFALGHCDWSANVCVWWLGSTCYGGHESVDARERVEVYQYSRIAQPWWAQKSFHQLC